MGVSKDKAWFSVTKSSADTFGLKHYPFAFMAQFFKAEKLLMVDHATLHRISGKIKKFDGNCIMINNTGRCGSTLLCQVSFQGGISILNQKYHMSIEYTHKFIKCDCFLTL